MGVEDSINFLPGMLVYVRDNSKVWEDGIITSTSKNKCTVIVVNKKETREYSVNDVLPRSEQCLQKVHSLTDLSPINQAAVLCCLEERFADGQFYTNAGSTIVAVNPFRIVEHLYTLDTVLAYHSKQEDDPHIYRVGDEAYTRLCRELGHINQCIIVSGESGSGKTVSAKHMLRYMTVVSNSTGNENFKSRGKVCDSIEEKILDSNPILEAFGNAVTQRNENSSRFGKFIQLQFARGGEMMGAEIKTYLLEKTRVVHQLQGEANFHIFYQIMESVSQSEGTVLGKLIQDMGKDAFKVLPVSKAIVTNRNLQETLEAMTQIGIPELMQGEITKVLVAILFLCNIEIKPLEDDLCQLLQEQVTETSLRQAAELLGLQSSHMEQVLLYRHIESGGNKRRSVFVKPVPQREAYSRRDCLATVLYSRLFDWLVGYINTQIQSTEYDHTIGLLDIYGFEAFETNSLEQLCINYANEKLQQHYVKHFLKDLQKEYEEECIDWQHLTYNDNQPCLDILEGQPSVFGLLSEDVQLNRKTDTTHLCERILQLSQISSRYIKRPKNYISIPGFTLSHYAGDVTYSGDGLSTKNRDNIPQELIVMLRESKNKFISELFNLFETEEQQPGRTNKRKTVLGKFKTSLDSLMSSLQTSDVHYIRCIKPNTRSIPHMFDRQYVMAQLTASGIIETVKVSCLGYPVRIKYPMFLQRYGLLIRNARTLLQSEAENVCDTDTLYDPLDALYRKQLDMVPSDSPRRNKTPRRRLRRRAGLSSADHTRRCSAAVLTLQFGKCPGLTKQFGRTKLFLHQHQVDSLEQARFDIISSKATMIQSLWRRYSLRCKMKRRRKAACVIQSAWRKYSHLKHSIAVIKIQKTFRMHFARKRFSKIVATTKERKQKEKKSWKPILDRKRTSPGTGRLSHSSEKSDVSLEKSSEQEYSSSDSITSSPSISKSNEKSESDIYSFSTSTPRSEIKKSPMQRKSDRQNHKQNKNKENIEMIRANPRGRPDMSKYSPVKLLRSYSKLSATKRSNSSVSMDTGSESHTDKEPGVSPRKKQKLADSSEQRAFHLQNGILTRRCIPKIPVRFHTRASVLKYGHYIHQKELPSGLSDCLPDNQ